MKKIVIRVSLGLLAINSIFLVLAIPFNNISAGEILNITILYVLFFGFFYFIYKKIKKDNEDAEMYDKALKEEEERKEREYAHPEHTIAKRPFFEKVMPNANIQMTFITKPAEYKSSTDKLVEAAENFSVKKAKPDKEIKQPTEQPKPIVEEGKSKAEQEGNTILNEEGKPIVKPNYKMIASEWIKTNFDLLNKICNDAYAISGGSGSYTATIPKDFLPEEKATWIIIGKTLVSDDDISAFKIVSDGLEVTVE